MATLVCIEDETFIRADIVDVLRDVGHEIHEAENADEGLAAIFTHKPDLVICDINMPGRSGIDLLSEIRTNHIDSAHIPFVFLTALSDRKNIIACKQAGGVEYLTKPVDFEVLKVTVQSQLEKITQFEKIKQAELDEFGSNILRMLPHELRTPLNIVMGYADIIRSEFYGPISNPSYTEAAENIHTAGTSLMKIVEDTLFLVGLMTGNHLPDIRECDIGALCRKSSQAAAGSKSIKWDIDVSDTLSRWKTDEEFLTRILEVLLSNAVKFTPTGGTIRVENRIFHGGGMKIVITDTGVGISPHKIPKILKVFGQADSGLTRKFDGLGIGIPHAKCLTEVLGGKLEIKSESNVGTTVTLTFPPINPVSIH